MFKGGGGDRSQTPCKEWTGIGVLSTDSRSIYLTQSIILMFDENGERFKEQVKSFLFQERDL